MKDNTDPKNKIKKQEQHPTVALLTSINYDSNMVTTPMERTVQSGSGDMYGYDVGLGRSRFDEGLSPASQIDFTDFEASLEDYRSKQQSGLLKTGALLGRVGVKVASEVAKMPGIIGGVALGTAGQIGDLISGKDNTDFIQTAFNNKWVNAVGDAEEYLKEEALPVYVKKSVAEGNLWDNISSIDFWATEGADGIGYITAMLAPGALINKLGVGSKIMSNTNKYISMNDKRIQALQKLNELGLPVSAKNIDLFTATLANTTFEAAAEAKSSMDALEQELLYRAQLPPNDPNYLSEEQLEQELQNLSKVGANVFGSNFAILLGPNAIMSKMLWGKTRNRTPNGLLKNNRLEVLADPKLSVKLGRVGKDILYAGGREGLWEEGMQSTVENYFTENPNANISDLVGDIGTAYIDMFSSTEGQKAMFLGAFLGGGIQAYTGAKNRKKERTNTNKLIEAGNTMLTDFYNVFNEDVYVKDEQGNVVFEEKMVGNKILKQPKVDEVKIMEKLSSVNQIESLSAMYDLAVENNNKDQIKQIKDILTTNLVKPFIVNDNIGLEVLEQHLKESSELADINEREGTDNQEFISKVINKAKKLKADYTLFENFGQDVFNLQNENAKPQEIVDFYNKLASQYLDTKSRKYFVEQELQEVESIYKDLLNEKDISFDKLETNQRLRQDLKTQDLRIDKIDEKYSELKNQVKKVDKILDAFWDGKSASNKFNSEIKQKRKLESELEELKKESEEIVKKFNEAKTLEELDNIEIPDNSAKIGLEAQKNERRKELEKELEDELNKASQEEEDFEENEINRKLKEEEDFNFISENYNVGEDITIPEISRIPKEFHGETATIKSIDNDGITLETLEGKPLKILPTAFIEIFNGNEENNYVSEGGTDTLQEQVEDITSKLYEDRNQPRIVITDNNKGEKLSFVDQAALDFERSPINKIGDSKNIEINNSNNLSDNQQLAANAYNNNDYSDINLLIDYLPLNIKLTDSVVAPLETKSEKSKAYNDIFNKTSKDIRTTIVKELAKGTKIEDITVDIGGQNNGQIQLTSPVQENNITGLYEFGGDINNIKTEDIYFVDDFGLLKNSKEDIFPTKRALAPGEIYLKINTAAGNPFPLKLNVAKISEDKAELLYELYKYRFKKEEGESKRISTFEESFYDNFKSTFSDIINLFYKKEEDITVKDVIDLLVWEGTKSIKSQVKFTKSGKLLLFDKSFTEEEFSSIEGKEKFIDVITNNKRHQIKFKRKETDTNNLNISENRKYLEYLINNSILNTNAVIEKPTFQGKTTMYLDKTSVKVNGKLSEYNSDIKKTYSTKIIGNNTTLKNTLPGLFTNNYSLNETEDAYIDKDGLEYKRATSLKDKPFNSKNLRMYNASKRGDVVDELVRLFFSKNLISKKEFINRGELELKNINRNKPNTELEISKNYFESLYNILEQYKDEFDNLGYTIYSNAPTIGGTIGSKGRIAGTVDLLAFDNNNKQWVFIDLKTSTQDRGIEYNKENDPEYIKKKKYSYKEQDKIQLNTYKELFYQTTGEIIGALKVMPLTSKSENTDTNNTTFFDISSSKEGLLLDVEIESIYDILSINKKQVAQEEETEEEKEIRATQGNKMLAKFGIKTKAPAAKPIPKPKAKKVISNLSYEEMRIEAAAEYKENNYSVFNYNNNDYILTFNFYAINATKGELISDPKQTERIFIEYNKVAANDNAKFNIDNLKAFWSKRIQNSNEKESIEAQKTQDILDLSKLSDAKAKEIFTKLISNFKVYIKDMQNISKKHKNIKDKVQAILNYLKDKNISEEQIKTKCNL